VYEGNNETDIPEFEESYQILSPLSIILQKKIKQKIMNLNKDVWWSICEHAQISQLSKLLILNHEITSFISDQVLNRLQKLLKYKSIITLMRDNFHPNRRHLLEQTGLRHECIQFIKSGQFSHTDVLLFEEVDELQYRDCLDIFLCKYKCQDNTCITLTFGSVLQNFIHEPVRTYFQGRAHFLKFYTHYHGKITLPTCQNSKFFSWGFAQRVGGVGDFADALLLGKD
jgi:hypothetical protein